MQVTISCCRPAGKQDLRGQLHVATAANAVLHTHHHIRTLVFQQTLVTRARAFIHSRGQLLAIGFQLRQLLFQILLPVPKFVIWTPPTLRASFAAWVASANFLLRRFGLLHQIDLLVFQSNNGLFASSQSHGPAHDIPRSSWSGTVAAHIFQFAASWHPHPVPVACARFQSASPVLGGFQVGLRAGGLCLQRLPFRFNVSKLGLDPLEVSVAVLKDEQLFNDFEHLSKFFLLPSYPRLYSKSMHRNSSQQYIS